MTWPFENDTNDIVKKLAKKSLKSEKRRNLMVVTAVLLAAFLISFTGIVAASLLQMQRRQVVDTYEAVYNGIGEDDVKTLKGLTELARVGGYYMLGKEQAGQGYHASYVYCDEEMIYIARSQMELVNGRLPEKFKEIAVSEYFLSVYGAGAQIGDTITLDTESFCGEYTVTGIMECIGEKETNTFGFVVSKEALTEWKGFDPDGYRAYVHFKNDRQLDEEAVTSRCREISSQYELPSAGMNHSYFVYRSKTIDFSVVFGIAALVMVGGSIVIQSIFRISVNDKIQSYGQLRTIGTTQKQLRRIVKMESRRLGSIGILAGILLGVGIGLILFPKGFYAPFYAAAVILTILGCWFILFISVRGPVKIAAGRSPLEAQRFFVEYKSIRGRKKRIRLNPVSMGVANFKRDRKKAVSIVASLSLGGLILLAVSSAILTRSPVQYARRWFPDGDFKIYLDSEQPEEEIMAAGNPLNEELRQEILSVDGITDVLSVRQSIHADFSTSRQASAGMCDMLTGANASKIKSALVSGTMPADTHSVILGLNHYKHFDELDVGGVIELTMGQQTRAVTISGIYDTEKILSGHGSLGMDMAALFAPEGLFHEFFPKIECFDYSWSIVSDSRKAQGVKEGLLHIAASHSNIGLDTIDEHIAYEKMQNTFIFGSIQALSWLILLFGAVNLINTTLSNQMSRRRENSMLRAIGLTSKQLCQMNVCEGMCYAFFSASAVMIVGIPVSAAVCAEISRWSFGGEIVPYQFPVLEMALFMMVLFGMELILSVWTVRRQRKLSLADIGCEK